MGLFRKTKPGQSVVEILVAIGIAGVVLPALLTGFVASRQGKVTEDLRLRATGYLKEAQEATRVFREKDWSIFAQNGTYHPVISGTTWSLANGQETISDFTRSIVIADDTPADLSIKIVTTTVSWGNCPLACVSSQQYYTRYVSNSIVPGGSGSVQPAAGGNGDWCAPTLSINPVDLPKSGVANAITAIQGQVFAGTGDNASGVSFADVAISNTSPPVGNITATFDGYKTNGVFGESGYAYLATDNNSKEVVIINLNQIVGGKYQEAGSFNAPGNGNANSVYVTPTYGYMTSSFGNKLYNFNKIGSSLAIDADGVALDGTGNSLAVVGNYAYVAIGANSNQLDIIDISNPANLTKIKSFTVNGKAAKGIFVNPGGTRAYLVTASSSSQNEFFVIDITNKNNPALLGSYDTAGMDPKGVTVVNDIVSHKAIVVGTGGTQQYQVIDLINENSPVHCTSGGKSGGLAIATGINGVSSVLESDGDAYSYIITGDSNAELKIISGGPGSAGGGGTGTFESSTFDAGHDVAFNYFSATADPNLSYKIAIKHGSGGSCGAVNFSDPDFVPISQGTIALPGTGYTNPGQCLRYRVINSGSTTINFNVSINYSP